MNNVLIEAALNEIGVKELKGPVENTPRILEYFLNLL